MRFALASKKIIFTDRLNADNLDTVIGEIEKKYYKAMIHPGESIGSMAAQSIGEPTYYLLQFISKNSIKNIYKFTNIYVLFILALKWPWILSISLVLLIEM